MLVASEKWPPKSRLRGRRETNPKKCDRSWSLTLVPHRPYTGITSVILISLPRGPTDVQVRVRSTCEHHHGARVPHHGGKASCFRIEWPEDHPVGTDGNRRASRVERVRKASLGCAVQHVNQARRGVRRLRLSGKSILKPDHTHRIESHIGEANNI